MIVEFPKRDVITQAELEVIAVVEGGLDQMLGPLYKRFEAGAIIEPGLRNAEHAAAAHSGRRRAGSAGGVGKHFLRKENGVSFR